jgi:hypothetical protein
MRGNKQTKNIKRAAKNPILQRSSIPSKTMRERELRSDANVPDKASKIHHPML